MLDSGCDYRQKNKIRRMAAQGVSPQAISRDTRISERLVNAVLSYSTQNQSPQNSDQFGPLPDTPEWNELSPGARSGLTRKRQNAEKAG